MKLKTLFKDGGKRGEVLRFGLVGGFCTLLQYGIYVVFVEAVKVPAVVSTLISYAISFIANFILSSRFTFHSDPNAKKGLAFTASHLVNMGMQTGFVAIFKGIVGPTLALLPALAICVPLNYLMVRFAFTNKAFLSQSEKEARNA
ncbi:MAG: GtrA family protein [Muribaculaceae bacterium]|nr:GtrA family protein [Muribaculaceae bacterium]